MEVDKVSVSGKCQQKSTEGTEFGVKLLNRSTCSLLSQPDPVCKGKKRKKVLKVPLQR